MNGRFQPRWPIWIFCIFFISSGSFIAVKFGIWSIQSVQTNASMANTVFCMATAAFGFVFGCLSIVVFRYNRHAFLSVDEEKIQASFDWNTHFSLDLSDIRDVDAMGNRLMIWTDSTRYIISGLTNAIPLGEYLRARIPKTVWEINIDIVTLMLNRVKKKTLLSLIGTIAAVTMLFIHIGWCVLLTDGADFGDFTAVQDRVFLVFAFAEIITMVAAFRMASCFGKNHMMQKHLAFSVLAADAYEHRKDRLDAAVCSVLFFNSATNRIVIFSFSDGYAYMLEHYDAKAGWMPSYPDARGFSTLSELYDYLSNTFSDVILDELK